MRWLRWLLVLALLTGLGYLALVVEIGGRTLADRMTGGGGADHGAAEPAAPGAEAAAEAGAKADTEADTEAAADGAPASPAASDHHTDADRAELDRLIESRLQQEQGDGETEPH